MKSRRAGVTFVEVVVVIVVLLLLLGLLIPAINAAREENRKSLIPTKERTMQIESKEIMKGVWKLNLVPDRTKSFYPKEEVWFKKMTEVNKEEKKILDIQVDWGVDGQILRVYMILAE